MGSGSLLLHVLWTVQLNLKELNVNPHGKRKLLGRLLYNLKALER
jgi:hypothetical protein